MKDIRVLVSGTGNITGINIVRALKDNIPFIIGTDYSETNPANKFCKNCIIPRANNSDYINVVLELVRKYYITHIITSNDHEVRALSININELKKEGVLLNGFSVHTLDLLDKRKTSELFQRYDITTPDVLNSFMDFPCVLRKNLVGDQQKFVYIIKSERDIPNVSSYDTQDIIITKFIEGNEYTIDVLCDENSEVLSVVPRLRKKVQYGMVQFAEIVKDPVLISKVEDLSKKLRLTGVNCIQCITQNGKYYFTEINARPGSGLDLTINAGVNMPLIWVNLSIKKSISIPEPDWGLKMLRYYDGYYYK
jgi:carbamoyl-phosphate synthase large subunit